MIWEIDNSKVVILIRFAIKTYNQLLVTHYKLRPKKTLFN